MRRLFLRLLLSAISALILCSAQNADTTGKAKNLTAEDLKKLIDDKTKFFFLDVREPKEIAELGTMQGYVNIPISQLEARVSEVPKSATVVTACSHGKRAARAAEILQKSHINVIGSCGLMEWKEKGFDKQKGYELIYPKESEIGKKKG